MEEPKQPREGNALPLQGPHWSSKLTGAEPRVPPLKLVLQPSGMTVELTRPETVVGRHMTADLRLPLPDVSRQHCRFVHGDEGWRLVDAGSLNGVYVNHVRVKEATLKHGDMVRIGSFFFFVELATGDTTLPLPETSSSERVLKSISDALSTQSESRRQAS
jgi:pSer/pThr/pTyr-binding forkhead associated (FHA) protein